MLHVDTLDGHLFKMQRFRCCLLFLSGGIGIGAWVSTLPLLAAKMEFNKGELGILLLGFAVGAILLMVNVGRYLHRGSYLFSFWGSLCFGAALIAVPFTETVWLLAIVVVCGGAGFGTLDVSMNTEASKLEIGSGKNIMSSFHAIFSIGNIVGAFAVAQAINFGATLTGCLTVSGGLVILAIMSTLLFSRSERAFEAATVDTATQSNKGTRLTTAQKSLVYLIGVCAFLTFLAEGGIMDWTAIYMVGNLHATETTGAYAFAVFAATMALGRLVGDYLVRWFGHLNVLRVGGVACALSLALMLSANSVELAFVALGLCGFGVANMVPSLFASAGRVGGKASGRAMSIVSTMGYSGLLLGPAALGFIAQISNLWISFCFLIVAFSSVVAGTYIIQRQQTELNKAQSRFL